MKLPSKRWWIGAVIGLSACGVHHPAPSAVPAVSPAQLAVRVYLIGDAGAPDPEGEPVLQALRRELDHAPGERVVVFLGDNAYPRGLPEPGRSGRAAAERSLAAQIEAVTRARATGYFVLGNHDWKAEGGGWAGARRQDRFIDSAGMGLVQMKPDSGCPGPAVIDVGPRLRLALLNTDWWLRPRSGPHDQPSSCSTDTASEIADSVRYAISTAGERLVVVAGHHPLTSGGVHGGYFGWRDHFFPLRIVVPGLWIPLPLIGSLYPAARQHGISSQDIPSPAYQRLIAALDRAFSEAKPALYAAGHEHNLQVIAGGPAGMELVSGAGIYGHSGRAVPVQGSLFAHQASGFARLDIPWNGRARLAVLEVDERGKSHEAFSTWLE